MNVRNWPWPAWIEQHAGLARTLDDLAEQVGHVRGKEDNALSSAEIAAEARAIERAAIKLKDQYTRLEGRLGQTAYKPPACVKSAARVLGHDDGTLTAYERAWIDAGLSAEQFAAVVHSLTTHMQIIHRRHRARDGAPKKTTAAWAVGVLAIRLHDAGVDLGRRNAANIQAVCEALFRRAEWPEEPTERTLLALTKARHNLIKGLW